jgi:hypothetical protein
VGSEFSHGTGTNPGTWNLRTRNLRLRLSAV